MAKRNTVRINMDLLDGYLKAKNIHPKDFCEKQLGFSDGWYYGIRKNGGRGVKVLVAQLIARSIGVEYETLVVEDAAGASPRPTERAEEDAKKDPYSEWLEEMHESIEADKRKNKAAGLFQEIDALKAEKFDLLEKVKAREDELEKVSEMLAVEQRERKGGVMEISFADLLPIMCYDLLREEIDPEYVRGYLSALNSIFKYDDIRKEKSKNARPE